MVELLRTPVFDEWLSGLKDGQAVARIAVRLDRLAAGNPGKVKPVGNGVSELKIDYGPGYRVYFMQRGSIVILLLCGGDKSSQRRDIKTAKALAEKWKDQL
ncbi:type II toxin-antitoxin system RelE/ParE family toxin [Roseivivax sediminis]|uniref:Putative addiction module killer protein n=1 Tax=Roseivivax sediminis TaxID=936889 RepID=A0A1I2EQZ0_9RHOB|nr:type II toxin-antitoxin system RelE/ParE family toxin [Roseivivax sediminis]SFE95047.1 putative addiction module killer protein [Roseivivax sediminis]